MNAFGHCITSDGPTAGRSTAEPSGAGPQQEAPHGGTQPQQSVPRQRQLLFCWRRRRNEGRMDVVAARRASPDS